MFLPNVLVLILALTSVTSGEKYVYPIINMTDATPYDQIPCSGFCNGKLSLGLGIVSAILGSVLNKVPFPVDFCQECALSGLGGFTYAHKCFQSPDGKVFDHLVDMTFNNITINCECDLSNSPSTTAKKINSAKAIEGQCGKENYKNKQRCQPLACESQTGEGESQVSLAANLAKNSVVSVVLRVDTRQNPETGKTGAFPLSFSVNTEEKVHFNVKGSPEFKEAGKCLEENMDALICQTIANAATPFYDCLSPEDDFDIIHNMLYLFGKC